MPVNDPLSVNERTILLQTLASAGTDVSKTKPLLSTAYKIVSDAAK